MRAYDYPVREYRAGRGSTLATFAVGGIIILVFGWMLLCVLIPGFGDPALHRAPWLFAPIALFMIAFMGIAMLNTARNRITVGAGVLTEVTAFSDRSLRFEDISGYRVSEKGLMRLELQRGGRKIRIGSNLERVSELQAWIRAQFPDLDLAEAEAGEKALRYDSRHGLSETAREDRLRQAKRAALLMNITGVLAAAWQIAPKPYLPALMAALLMPPLIVAVVARFRGLIRVDVEKNSRRPTVFSGLLLSSCVLTLRSFADFDILDYSSAWVPVAVILAALLAALRINNEDFAVNDGKSLLRMTGVVLSLGLYGYGAVVTSNCAFDRSKPAVSEAVVEDRWVTSDKVKSYHVQLSAYGTHAGSTKMQLRYPQYKELEKGSRVLVYEKAGAFGIPWRRIALKRA